MCILKFVNLSEGHRVLSMKPLDSSSGASVTAVCGRDERSSFVRVCTPVNKQVCFLRSGRMWREQRHMGEPPVGSG